MVNHFALECKKLSEKLYHFLNLPFLEKRANVRKTSNFTIFETTLRRSREPDTTSSSLLFSQLINFNNFKTKLSFTLILQVTISDHSSHRSDIGKVFTTEQHRLGRNDPAQFSFQLFNFKHKISNL